jgi:BolA family transcriptional regulator, general stress-responsive regulator
LFTFLAIFFANVPDHPLYHKKEGFWEMSEETYHARMARKLNAAFAPSLLEIKDDSAQHAGHAGQHPLGESHFSIKIVSPAFEKMNPLTRHREVYRVLAVEIKERVHALSLQTMTPDEYIHR